MADLIQIKTDGSETGATAAVKINNGFDKTDSNRDQLDGLIAEDIPARVTVLEDNMVTIPQADLQKLLDIQAVSDEPTGFDLRDHSTHGVMELCGLATSNTYWRLDENNLFTEQTGTTFGDGVTTLADKTFVQYPSISSTTNPKSFSFWNKGNKFVKTTTQIITLSATSLKQIVVYDENGIIDFSDSVYEAITQDTIAAVISGHPALTKKVIFANERHGLEMNGATHEMLHNTIGAAYGDGLKINGLASGVGTYTNIETGTIWDEDLKHTVLDTTDTVFAYRLDVDDSGWTTTGAWTLTNYVDSNVAMFDGIDVQYNSYDVGNDRWGLTSIGAGNYIIMHIFATNDGEFPIFKVLGQNVYTSRVDARNNLDGDVTTLISGDLPTPEFCHLYSMIVDADGNVYPGADGEIYVDYKSGYPASRF